MPRQGVSTRRSKGGLETVRESTAVYEQALIKKDEDHPQPQAEDTVVRKPSVSRYMRVSPRK